MGKEGFTIAIPVKPYVKKYLQHYCPGPLQLSLNNSIGVFLFHLLRRPLQDERWDKVVAQYPDKFEVIVSRRLAFDKGAINLTSKCVIMFNTLIENEMKSDMYRYVNICTTLLDKDQNEAIQEYMNRYQMTDDDITADGLKKSYYRMRKTRNISGPLFWKRGKPNKKLPSPLSPE